MLTSKDLRDARFDKKMLNGYDPEQVDKLLDDAAETFDALNKENALLNEKIRLLAVRVEEYHQNEVLIKDAMVTAQRVSGEMIDGAKKKSEEILSSAKIIAENKIAAFRDEIRFEEQKLREAKKKTGDFLSRITSDLKRQLADFDALSKQAMPAAEQRAEAPALPADPASPAAAAPVASSILPPPVLIGDAEEAPASVPAAPADAPAPAAEESHEKQAAFGVFEALTESEEEKPREEEAIDWDAIAGLQAEKDDKQADDKESKASRFAGLKFGREYDITKDIEK